MHRRNPIEHALEVTLFQGRWLLAPFYLGLIGALVLLLVKFVQEFLHVAPSILDIKESQLILAVLSLIDLSLAANLLLMVVLAGYENFVSKIDLEGHPDKPDWMGKIDFGGMKLKLIASIVAISAIHLLKAFMDIQNTDKTNLAWLVGIHMAFVVSGVLLALMDFIISRSEKHN